MGIFGLELEINPVLLVFIIIISVLSIVGVIALFLRWRKKLWYAFISATLSILIAILIPLILDQLFWIQIASENSLLIKVLYAFESSFIVLILKRILGWGFDISNKTVRDQS